MRYQQAVDFYRHVAVETADPLSLVIMAYEGALGAIDRAVCALREGDYQRKGEEIQKAMDLISELMAALDLERGGRVARSLSSLYTYFLKRLMTGNAKKDEGALLEVRDLLAQLCSAWGEIARAGAGKAAFGESWLMEPGEGTP
ncbi:MAG: flagellar export chaperone FliS [Thermodesulfobacteriota bacterium]